MEIQFSVTREYTISIDDDDSIALATVDAVLNRHHLQGDDMAERVQELYRTDNHAALEELSTITYADLDGESWSCDSAEGPEPEPEEEEEEEDEDEDEDEDDGPVDRYTDQSLAARLRALPPPQPLAWR